MPKALVIYTSIERQYDSLHLAFDVVLTNNHGVPLQREIPRQVVPFAGSAALLNAAIEQQVIRVAEGAGIEIKAADVIAPRFA